MKELFHKKYDPNNTHLKPSTTMNHLQKRRLIKTCIDNGIDTQELDAKLNFAENKNMLTRRIKQE